MPISQRLLVGRLILDGASLDTLAQKTDLSLEIINDCWQYCRERLSRHFTESSGEYYRLYGDDELQARIADCIELLLAWRENLLYQDKLINVQIDVDDPQDTE